MTSRKRKAETAIRNAFVAWADTAIDGVHVITGRSIADLDPVNVRIHCPNQNPLEGFDEISTRVEVSGSIVVTQSFDEQDLTQIEDLEALAETFIEMDTATLLGLLNAEATDIQFTDFQPDSAEDGINPDFRQFVSRYSFSAYVRDITPDPIP